MILHWSDTAIFDMAKVHEYISQSNPLNAERFLHPLAETVDTQLSQFPESGRIVPEMKNPIFREVPVGSYRVLYHFDDREITILAVRNSKMTLDSSILDTF